MTEKDPLPSLDTLQRKIDTLKQPEQEQSHTAEITGFSLAMRLSIELIAGVAVGTVGGWYLDKWLDSGPWCLMVGVMLGAAAGFRNMMRTASQLDKAPDSDTTPRA